jgi:hypothetical protein
MCSRTIFAKIDANPDLRNKKRPKVKNNHPMGKNSPNLVTLSVKTRSVSVTEFQTSDSTKTKVQRNSDKKQKVSFFSKET